MSLIQEKYLMNQFIIRTAIFLLGVILLFISLPNIFFHLWLCGWGCLIPVILLGEKLMLKKRLLLNFAYFFIALTAVLWIDVGIFLSAFGGYDVLVFLFFFLIIVSFGYGFVLTMATYFYRKTNNILITSFVIAAFWVLFEYLLSLPDIIPLTIALSQYDFPIVLQNVSGYSVFGISFLIIFTNCILAFSSRNIFNRSKVILSITILILIHAANYSYGLIKMSYYDRETKTSQIKVALVQPSFHWTTYGPAKVSNLFLKEELDRLFDLSKKATKNGGIDLIVWPENAIARDMEDDADLKNYIKEKVRGLNASLITGVLLNDKSGKQFNSAAAFEKNGLISSYYKKTRLFPVVEEPSFSAGKTLSPLPINNSGNYAGAMICYESLFAGVSRDLVKKGADFLLLLSNDSIFGNSNWPILHASYMVFRAIENRKYGIHLNNNGNSLVVDGVGRKILSTPLNSTAVATVVLPVKR